MSTDQPSRTPSERCELPLLPEGQGTTTRNLDVIGLLSEQPPANPSTAEVPPVELFDSQASGLRRPLQDGECDPRGPYPPFDATPNPPGTRPAEGVPSNPPVTRPAEGTPTDSVPPTPRPVFPPPFYPTPGTEGMPIGRPGVPRDGSVPIGQPGVPRQEGMPIVPPGVPRGGKPTEPDLKEGVTTRVTPYITPPNRTW